jgi:predicted Zn-dependent protease
MTFKEQERYHDALFYVKRAMREEPENTEYMLELADLFFNLEQVEDALLLYEKITSLNPGMLEAWLDWSHALAHHENYGEAISILEEGLFKINDAPEILYRLASYNCMNGAMQTGVTYLQTALEKDFSQYQLFYDHASGFTSSKLIQDIIDLHRPNNNYNEL